MKVFQQTKGRPTFIVLDSHIGYGSPNRQDTAAAHGEPLGDEEIRLCKRAYNWAEDAKFLVPDGVPGKEHLHGWRWQSRGSRDAEVAGRSCSLYCHASTSFPGTVATEIDLMQRRGLPAKWDANLPTCFRLNPKGIAGRVMPRARSSTCWPRTFLGSWEARPI